MKIIKPWLISEMWNFHNIECRLAVFRLLKTKSGTLFKNSAWVEGGARTHDIQNHNLTL